MATLADLQAQRDQFFKQKGEQAQGQIQGQTQANVGALQRRFTSMGAGNTGAALAAEQKAREEGIGQQRQAMSDISGQQLQAGEGDLGRAFQSEEARVAREAQLGEAEKGRGFQRELSQQDLEFKRKLADTEQGNKLKEMDMAYQQFLLDQDTTEFNKALSEFQAGGGFKYNPANKSYTSTALEDQTAKRAREDQIIAGAKSGMASGGAINVNDLPKSPEGYSHGQIKPGSTTGLNAKPLVWDTFKNAWIPVTSFSLDKNLTGIDENSLKLYPQYGIS